jgi:hypothetical protein
MSSVIKLKRSSTGGAVPSSLQTGELAINLADKKLYSSRSNGQIITISGDQYNLATQGNNTQGEIILTVDNDTLSNDTIIIVGDNGTVVSGNSTQLTVDSTTYAVTTTGNSSVGQIVLTPTGGGDATSDTLNVVGANGIVVSGNSTQITVTAEAFDYDLSAGGTATTGTVILGDASGDDADLDTVTFSGANNITVTNTSTSAIAVSLNDTVNLTAAGSLKVGNSTVNTVITSTSIDTDGTLAVLGDTTLSSNVAVTENLTVTNSATFSNTVAITGAATFSNTITSSGRISVGNSTVNAVIATTGNIDTDGTLTVAGVGSFTDQTNSTSNTTGSVVISGGLGVGKSVTIGEDLTVHGNFTVEGTTTTVNSSTVTIDDAALKLADNQADTATFTDAADFGIYGEWGNTSSVHYSGIFRDASANSFVVINDIATEPGTSVTYTAANSTSSGDLGQLNAIIDGGTY